MRKKEEGAGEKYGKMGGGEGEWISMRRRDKYEKA